MRYLVVLDLKTKIRVHVEAPDNEKAAGCKASLYADAWSWPKKDLCEPAALCGRCTILREVDRVVIPESKDEFEVSIDKIKPLVSLQWAAPKEESDSSATVPVAEEAKDANNKTV